jgi:hypothetical protein
MTTYGKNGPVIIEEGSEVQNIIARQDFSLFLPTNVSVETFEWFMSGSMEFIMLKGWEEQHLGNDSTEYTVFNYVLAMLVDSRSGDIVRWAGIMAIPIEDRESKHAAQNLKQLLWGEVIF